MRRRDDHVTPARRTASSKSLMYAHHWQLAVNSWLYLWFWKAGPAGNLRGVAIILFPFERERSVSVYDGRPYERLTHRKSNICIIYSSTRHKRDTHMSINRQVGIKQLHNILSRWLLSDEEKPLNILREESTFSFALEAIVLIKKINFYRKT